LMRPAAAIRRFHAYLLLLLAREGVTIHDQFRCATRRDGRYEQESTCTGSTLANHNGWARRCCDSLIVR